MDVRIATPAPPGSLKGNRITAERWARLLAELGHRVEIVERWQGEPADVLVALHARRSFDSIEAFSRKHSDRPLVLALTGTDVYQDIEHDSRARQALGLAWRLVVLQPEAVRRLPEPLQAKARVIRQSARLPEGVAVQEPSEDTFDVAVLAHLRPVKDPLRAAEAARLLPETSRIRILHAGEALSPDMAREARAAEARSPRYRWLGPLPRPEALALLLRCRLLVLSSKLEGGANVVSEALALGVPVLSSRIEGSEGMLGKDHPGFFPVGNARALADLLHRAETDADFYGELQRRCRELQPLADPAQERDSWRRLLEEWGS